MNNKLFSIAFLSFIAMSFISCNDHIVADFNFSPTEARRGEAVTFTNLTTGDEDWEVTNWDWSFGDDYSSTNKNPTHIYKEAGIYTITLMVDSNDNYVKTKQITIYDSIPTICIDADTVKYFDKVTFSVLAYNPNKEVVTYEWTFSENAVGDNLTDGVSTSKQTEVHFTQKNVEEIVRLHIEIGDSAYDVADTFYVYDVKANSILMAEKNGNILRQRIIENGLEDYTETSIDAGIHPFNIKADAGMLYIFDAGTNVTYNSNWLANTSGDGSIRVIDMSNNASTEIVHNRGNSSHFGFFNGYVDNQHVYWTDFSEFVYKTSKTSTLGAFDWEGDAQTSVPYYLAKADRLGYYNNGLLSDQLSGGICGYDQAYFWAKGGTGKGIFRFTDNDILADSALSSTPLPTLGAILTGYAIRAFTIDEINQKIYFSVTAPADKIGLWVANMSGTGAVRIDNAPMDNASLYITGIVVDNVSNRVYWAYRSPETVGAASPSGTWAEYYEANSTHRTGIKCATLATQYKPTGAIEYFSLGVSAYGIALDEVKR